MLDLGEAASFVSLRRAVRGHLAASAVGREIDRLVGELLAAAG